MNDPACTLRDARKNSIESFVIAYPDFLPISSHISEIKDLWQKHQLIILGGATGSGKTTQLPKVAIELGRGIAGRIGCTQPRRIAATAMARRLASELKTQYGSGVGSQVRFEDRTSKETVLKFMTDGILLAEFRDDPLLRQYDTIIIDEAHERSLNIDFLLGLIKNILRRRKDLKIAISSATLDLEKFQEFFPDAPVITVEGRTFPVEDIYLMPDADEELPEHVARAVELLSSFDSRGNILVFLPGEREIRECTDMLNGRNYRNTEVLPLYARLSNADQQKVFQPTSKRRIILSTNVAETSLTIPDVKFCIDSGLARISRYNPRTRIQELQIEMISQASVRQRRGRCGRTADGICVHLYSEDNYNRMMPFTDPEIKRSSLAGVILQMAALKLPDIYRFPFIEPPKNNSIREGIRTLCDLKAFDRDLHLTPDGRMLARLPLDPAIGKMLLSSSSLKVVPQLLVLTAALTVGDVRERPAEKTQAADEAHRRWKDENSDFIALLNCWNALTSCTSNTLLRKFCQQNFLNLKRVREWRNLVTELADAIRFRQEFTTVDTAAYDHIHDAVLSGIPRNIATLDKEERVYRGTDGKKFLIFPGSGLAGKKRKLPEWILCFHLVETSRVFGRTAAAISPDAIERCAGHLCGRVYDSEHFEARSGYVRARERIVLGGLTVNSGRQVDFGRCNMEAAREIFIREGILTGAVELPSTPLAKFTARREELLTLELRMRRPGQLYDENAAARFFITHTPPEVNSVKSLKKYMSLHPDSFDLSPDDLMLEQFIRFSPEDFPSFLEFDKVKFALSYHFEPGSEYDGVTLLVKESMLNILPDRVLDYPIPGYYADFGEAMLRALPKELRRKFDGSISQTALRFADYLKNDISARQLPPPEAMAEFLLYDSEITIPPRAFESCRIPEYLKLKLGILNEKGQLKERLRELPGRMVRNSKLSAALPGAARHIGHELSDWPDDAGVMPESVEIPPRSGRISYPALSVEKGQVSRQLFLKLNEARRRHKMGVLKLFILSHEQQFKFLKRSIRLSNEIKMSLVLGANMSDFEDHLLYAALNNAADCDLWEVRSRVKFDEVCETMQMNWADEIDKIIKLLEQYSSEYSAIRALARRAKDNDAPIIEHLDLLFSPGFLRRPAVMTDYPRYLRALKIRAERLVNAPARDMQKGEILEDYLDKFYAAWETVGDITFSDGLYDFWLLLEECRIALFSPELRCKIKSPLAKLDETWENLIL